MLTGVRRVPILYEPGTILDSSDKLRIFTQDTVDYAYLGTPFKIAPDMFKVIAFEQLHNLLLERGFIQFKKEELVPIYLKIYDRDRAYVLYYRAGIHEVVSRCNCTDIPSEFVRWFSARKYFEIVGEEYNWLSDYPTFADVLNDEWCTPGFRDSFDSAGTHFSCFDGVEWQNLGYGVDHTRDIGLKYTCSLDDADYDPCSEDDLLVPYTGRYNEIAYDALTEYTVREVILEPTDMQRWCGNPEISINRAHVDLPIFDVKEPVVRVTKFNADWLELCHYLQSIALPEFKLTFEVFNRSIVKIELTQDSRQLITPSTINAWMFDLSSLLGSWENGKYIIYKNAYDEVLIDACSSLYKSSRRLYYVDLMLAVILTRNIIRHARNHRFDELNI